MLLYKAQNKKSTPLWRGPALILDTDETGATVKFPSHISKVARFCVRKREEEKDVWEAELSDSVDQLGPRMWGRIWRWAGRMAILPRVRALRRTVLAPGEK